MIGGGEGAHERAQSVGVEGFQGPNAGQVDQFDARERRTHDLAAVLHIACRAGVLLDHVDGRKDGLVLERPMPHLGQTAHIAEVGVELVELALDVAGHDVRHAQVRRRSPLRPLRPWPWPDRRAGRRLQGKRRYPRPVLPASITWRSESKPIKPGTASTTRSASATRPAMAPGARRSATRVRHSGAAGQAARVRRDCHRRR